MICWKPPFFFPSDGTCGSWITVAEVCRVTISLVAIMLELTGGMTYIVPFMIAAPRRQKETWGDFTRISQQGSCEKR